MPQYAICFDLDTKAMDRDGLTESQKSSVYQQEGQKALEAAGLKRHLQYSMYATEDNEHAFETIMRMPTKLKELAPKFCRYVKRFLVVRVEDWGNITDLLQEAA